ncbi:ABC transporter ATP-binding protein [Ruminiclostridium cellulolyticum]|uniref:ABC transporter related n=1 Tax=Ruminiclostridium cellulolyticum (strain ATCC 35319 / DSM 5812 / JCM 6584 / H10) TaxID=394503 RepID=B8I018_RUMCH|nr:ABC transporter ATP-binding protein [Ruminiclostridium cellulolyticum]ACL75518.1 ABC transporter related [Ruminiclostridium cellulolyticum H10]
MDYILKTQNLCKLYKNKKAVNGVNINVSKGDIYGFLGQNGAGKTTTIRMILGLIKPTEGEVFLFGERIFPGQNAHYGRIGSVIETAGFYPNLTAVENLEIHRRLMGVTNKSYLEEALEITGLTDVRNKRVKGFSLGMKQRLGISRALLHKPEFLILDEPTNGLDPVGIKEIRKLIQDLSMKRKITVLVSSHILSEIQQIASKIGIIHEGALLEEIDFESLKKKSRSYIEIKTSDDKKASFLLEKRKITDYKVIEQGVIRVYEKLNESSIFNRILSENGVEVSEIRVMNDTLEDYFLQLTGGSFRIQS